MLTIHDGGMGYQPHTVT